MADEDEFSKAFRVAFRRDREVPDEDLDVRVAILKDGKMQEVELEELPDEVFAALEDLLTQLGKETEH
ncbi:hypothetical protein [Bradyrhizobium japonicum]|uniref:hypothetical protein n=1 Tax=Bradyrhizobium japonicum TaxID=375 RepID=UPI00117EEAF1|nr:hypothetical protein [Bradyrhizobium japonicum]